MALLGFWGFDDTVIENGTTAGGAGAGTGRTGGQAISRNGSTVTLDISSNNSTSIIFGFAMSSTANVFSSEADLVRFRESGVTHFYLTITNGHTINLKNSAGTTVASTASPIATPGVALPWHYFEVVATFADAGGSITLYKNGNVIASYSGDTRNGLTGVCNDVVLGGWVCGGANTPYYDDVYCLNTNGPAPYNARLGDIVVKTQLPDGNGDSSQWTGSDADSINNYQLVDEANSSSTDYVSASSAGLTDLYTVADIPTTNTVYAIQSLVYAAKSDGGIENALKAVAKGQLGTVREDTVLPGMSTSYISYPSQIQTTDPDGNPLTPTTVNAMQVGVRTA